MKREALYWLGRVCSRVSARRVRRACARIAKPMPDCEAAASSSEARPTAHTALKKISLAPFVALLYAYCAGGPFGFESMVSTSGPGMALVFMLTVPWLFSVPMAL